MLLLLFDVSILLKGCELVVSSHLCWNIQFNGKKSCELRTDMH